MFGQNIIRKKELDADGAVLQVQDVFYTIQGEGPFSGMPAVFVRLTGCNLRCFFCDTVWDDDNDKYETVADIADRVLAVRPKHCFLVVITGGEPCRQNLSHLVRILHACGLRVQIETAGTIWQPCLSEVMIVVSPKTAKVPPEFLLKKNDVWWKYIITGGGTDVDDGLPVVSTQRNGSKLRIQRPPDHVNKWDVFLSPCDEYDDARNALNVAVVKQSCLTHGYRAMIQLHKVLDIA